ncbi:MAG TPA: DUF4142 domain-containing protein [Myxococcales bacterium]|nr:DUF4142 domain-containing protein [Myxococcales bacterium]
MRKLLGTMPVATFVLAVGAAGRLMAAPGTPAAGSLDDAQIAQRVLAFGRAEVQTANAVKARLSTPPVWQLAQRLSVDDATLDQRFATLAAANQQSDSAGAADGGVADGQAVGVDLSQLSGADLEMTYVEREIATHTAMLAALDGELLPGAKSEDLRRGLIDLRAETVAHLGHAQDVRHELKVRALMAIQPEIPWPR